jgi:3-oxoacid CoA-transferase
VEEIVENGELKPEEVHVPGIYVNRIFKGEFFERRIDNTVFKRDHSHNKDHHKTQTKKDKSTEKDIREKIAKRAVKEIKDGMYVNLGIGMPTTLPAHMPPEIKIQIQCENGILGVGDYPTKDQVDPDCINAGKVLQLTKSIDFISLLGNCYIAARSISFLKFNIIWDDSVKSS